MKKYMAPCLAAALVACGGGGGGSSSSSGGNQSASTPGAYTVGGDISGLTATGLVLANGTDTTQPAPGALAFTLPSALPSGTSYQVSVKTQPAGLTCSVQNGNGAVSQSDIGNIAVSCSPAPGIAGTVSGLTGSGLVLANGAGVVSVAAGATQFTLPPQAAGTAYAVVVQTQPAAQHCSVSSGSGTVPAGGVADVRIDCSGHVLYMATDTSNRVDVLPLDASGLPQMSGMTQATTDQSPRRLVSSPDGKHLYACASGGNRIDQYDINADGTLAHMMPPSVPTGDIPNGLGFTPDGRFAYASTHAGSILMFSVGTDGALTPLATPSVATSFAATSVTISQDGKHLYTVGGSSAAAFSIGADGLLTPLATPAPVGLAPNDLVLSPSGKFAYVNSVSPGTIRQFAVRADGTLSALGDVSANLSSPEDITFSRDGTVAYVPDWDNNAVLQYAVGATGLLTPMATPSVAVGDGPVSVVLSDDGKKAYVANARGNTLAVFDVNGDGTLAAASMTSFVVPARPYHLLYR